MAGDQMMNIVMIFSGGLESVVQRKDPKKGVPISLPSKMPNGKNVNLKYLFKQIYDNFLVVSERRIPPKDPRYDPSDPEKELSFEEANSVLIEKGEIRAGNLVVINDADWECIADDLAEELGKEVIPDEIEISDGDNIGFITTLHGG